VDKGWRKGGQWVEVAYFMDKFWLLFAGCFLTYRVDKRSEKEK